MDRIKSHIEVVKTDVLNNPFCSHGPTLLFKQVFNEGNEKLFYACSACRDRKLCPFYLPFGRPVNENTQAIHKSQIEKLRPKVSHEVLYAKFCKSVNLCDQQEVFYCHNCNCLFFCSERNRHIKHDYSVRLSREQLRYPTKLLRQLSTNKKEAQYHFSKNALEVIVNAALNNSVTAVLCLGTPSIHEYVSHNVSGLASLLLDIDQRYYNFLGPEEFCWFNMFNNYFFEPACKNNHFIPYLKTHGTCLLVVLDPPFGGRIEPISYTLQEIKKVGRNLGYVSRIFVIWVFPYFMEHHMKNYVPELKMLDYKVMYENHHSLQRGKRGSPVRIFTDIPSENFPLPLGESYKYCELCKQWVSPENSHCEFCNTCSSKNGTTYIHCLKCRKCVKPTWKHCDQCNRCYLPPHHCNKPISETYEPHLHKLQSYDHIQKKQKKKKRKLVK